MHELNPDGVSIKGCQHIYAPAGQAAEYAPLAANPYRGCGHGCAYCLAPDTLVQKADGTTGRIADILIGEELIGIDCRSEVRRAWNYTFTASKVLNKIATRKEAVRITMENGRSVVCSDDHRWLTDRGWKHTKNLTNNNLIRFLSTGAIATPPDSPDYRRGYLAGMVRGDGTLKRYVYPDRFQRAGRSAEVQHHFRLALKDEEALDRSASYLAGFGVETHRFQFSEAVGARAPMSAIRTHRRDAFEAISGLVNVVVENFEWRRGWLAGIFDAEGSTSSGVIRIYNTDHEILTTTERALAAHGFRSIRDLGRPNGCPAVRVIGGLSEVVRFFNLMHPAIRRKLPVVGQALRGSIKVASIERLGETVEMVDITTSTENFVAEGLISHNCYVPLVTKQPRPEFDAGAVPRKDFLRHLWRDAEKYKAAKVQAQVMLSFSTDPYHPGDTDLTRSTIAILRDHGLGFCTLTKGGTRALRDIDLFRPARDAFACTMTTLEDAFSLKWERNAALPADRIKALQTFHEAGIFTWVSLEPTLDIEHSLLLVQVTHPYVDLYKIGRANYLKEITTTTDWQIYTLRMLELVSRLGVRAYFKKDLQPFLPPGIDNPMRIAQHH